MPMKLADSIKLSFNNILHRRLRAWLTLLGIIIGVAAVVAIVSIGEGAQASVTAQLSTLGNDIITVNPGFERAGNFFGGFRGGGGLSSTGFRAETAGTSSSSAKEPTLSKLDSIIIRGNPNVLYVNEVVSGRGELTFLSEKTSLSIQGVNPNAWIQVSNVELASGRALNSSDLTAVVIGDRIANSTFKQPVTLGRQVSLEGKTFTVVGIIKPSGAGFGFGGSDSTVYLNYVSAWTVTDVNKDLFSSIQAKVRDPEDVQETTGELTRSLMISRRVTEGNQDFSITSAQAIQERVSGVTDTLTLFLGAIAGVSLLVGAVGIANSMFTSVLEKTREIGIMKSLGSTNGEVLRLFIIESGLFGLSGGIIGVILGSVVSIGISMLGINAIGPGGQLRTALPIPLLIGAILLSTLIGIVSGIMPARAAAQLKPVEALRYE